MEPPRHSVEQKNQTKNHTCLAALTNNLKQFSGRTGLGHWKTRRRSRVEGVATEETWQAGSLGQGPSQAWAWVLGAWAQPLWEGGSPTLSLCQVLQKYLQLFKQKPFKSGNLKDDMFYFYLL